MDPSPLFNFFFYEFKKTLVILLKFSKNLRLLIILLHVKFLIPENNILYACRIYA